MDKTRAFWPAALLALAQCCACSLAAICEGQPWWPGPPTTPQRYKQDTPLGWAAGASTLNQQGPEAGSFKLWQLPTVCEKDRPAYAYAVRLGSAVTWYMALGFLRSSGATAVAEQLLHSIGLAWASYVDHVAAKASFGEDAEYMLATLQTQWRHVRGPWPVGLRSGVGLYSSIELLLCACLATVMAQQWLIDFSHKHSTWRDTFLDTLVPGFLCLAPMLYEERPYARAAAVSALMQAYIRPLHANSVFTALTVVLLSIPSVLSLGVLKNVAALVVTALMVCYLIVRTLLDLLLFCCKFLSCGSNAWWICKNIVVYSFLVICWVVTGFLQLAWLLGCAVCRSVAKFAVWIASGVNSIFVFLGATELAAAAVLGRHWARVKSHLHLQYKQVRRIHRRTAGHPVAFLTQTAHWLVTGDIGTTTNISASQSSSGAAKRQQRNKQSADLQQQQTLGPASWFFRRSSSMGSATDSSLCSTPTAHSNSTPGQGFDRAIGSYSSEQPTTTELPTAVAADEEPDLADLLQWGRRKDSSKVKPIITSTSSNRLGQLRTCAVSELVKQSAAADLAAPASVCESSPSAPVVLGAPKTATPRAGATAKATSAGEAKQQAKPGVTAMRKSVEQQSAGPVQLPASTLQTNKAVDSHRTLATAVPAKDSVISKHPLKGKAAAKPVNDHAKAAPPKQPKQSRVLNTVSKVDSNTEMISMISSKVAEAQAAPPTAAKTAARVFDPATAAADWPELHAALEAIAAVTQPKKAAAKAVSSAKTAKTKRSKANKSKLSKGTAIGVGAAVHVAAADESLAEDVASTADSATADSSTPGPDNDRSSTSPAKMCVPAAGASAAADVQDVVRSDTQQQQHAADVASSIDSSRCQTHTISPQVNGPYRPLMFSNSGSYASPRVSDTNSPPVSTAGTEPSQTPTASAAAPQDSPWSIPSAMADALGWPAASIPAGWTTPWLAAGTAGGLGHAVDLEHDSLAAATATAAANAVLDDSDDSSCVLCKHMPRTHACVHPDDEVCLCMCAGCSEVYDYVGKGCPLCGQSVDCMLVLK